MRTDHIYQAFGTGTLDPAAIRRFVAYAYRNWKRPAPTYLALVGDASQSFEKNGEQPQVPFHPINIRGWGVAASDDYYGKVAGDDDLSDLFVGRIPANNQKELSNVVHKTLLAETARPPGHWNNQTLLISGFEPSFTAQNYVLQSIATANDRQYARIDLYPGSPQYKSPAQLTDFYARLDSGFNLVTFVGHGGGAVWSDAGVLTLKAIDQGKLQGEYPINLVASITCLTGFFEDQNARSLGEELIRLDKGGAAAFYGAAGYISNLAGEALSAEVVQAATSNAYATTGEIIARAETMVRLRTGDAFLPILAEFNLLGDPALGIRFPAAEGKLELDPQVLAGGADLEAKGTGLAVQDGEAVASVLLDDSLESNAGLKVAGGAFSLQRTFPEKPMAVQNGKVLVHYWNDKESRVLSAPFSSLDWLIDSVTIDPAGAAPGDSVRVSLRLNTAYAKTAFTAGIVSYAVGGSQAPLFPGDNQLGLESDDGVHLKSVSKILLGIPATDLSGPRLHLAFRLSVQALDPNGDPLQNIPGLSSRVYSLPLRELPRLELPKQALHLPIQETPGVWVLFHNKGMGTAQGTRVAMTRNADGDSPGTDTLAYPENIPAGAVDSLFFPLEESELGGKRLRAALVPDRQGDLSVTSTSQDTIFGVDSRRLSSSGDTLRLDGDGAFASLPDSAANPVRLYWEKIAVSSLPAHLDPAGGNLPLTAYSIQAWPFPVGGFLLGWTDDTASALPKIARTLATVGKSPAWHYRDREGQTWIKLDSLPGSAGAIRAAAFRPGVYALLRNRDVTGPQIQLSSRGQTLLPDDYVPRQTPIDVVIRDGEGVDLTLHPPRLVSREQSLDSANHAEDPANGFPTLARINFLPTHASDRDSITVTARDVSGNQTTKTMVYRLGDDLRIRDLGSYPNPFADTATFVYSLTDYCDKVDLKIYSRSGRVVRALQQRNVVGYQEMEWDGRAESGSNVANGLYFLKVTAKAGSKETSKIFKLFKKQRK
ncbi:MAG: C25 family cysteine peptidase [Fibrobacteria bacterium]